MEHERQETSQARAITAPEEDSQATSVEPAHEETGTPSAFQTFRSLLDRARRGQQPVSSRRELSRDKSKSLFLLLGVSVALLLVFFGIFSSRKARTPLPGENARGPSLGRKTTPGQEQDDPAKTVTPMLSADVRQGDNAGGSQVTPQDVGGTSPRYSQFRQLPGTNGAAVPGKPAPGRTLNPEEYALKNVDFSDPAVKGTVDTQPASTSFQRVRL